MEFGTGIRPLLFVSSRYHAVVTNVWLYSDNSLYAVKSELLRNTAFVHSRDT